MPARRGDRVEERALSWCRRSSSLDVIAGQGTFGLEILEQRPDVETILVPVGGGGLIAGIACRDGRPEAGGSGHRGRAGGGGQAGRARWRRAGRSSSSIPRAWPTGSCRCPSARFRLRILSGVVREVDSGRRRRDRGRRYDFSTAKAGLSVEPSGAVTTAALLAGRFSLGGTDRGGDQRRQRGSRPLSAAGAT